MRLRSVSNCERSKKRFLPQKNRALFFVASALLSSPTSTALTPLKFSDLTCIVPVSRQADAASTKAASDRQVAPRSTEGGIIRTRELQRMCQPSDLRLRYDFIDNGVELSTNEHREPGHIEPQQDDQ